MLRRGRKKDKCLLHALETGCIIEELICIPTTMIPAGLMHKGCKVCSLERKPWAFVDKRINPYAGGKDQEGSERFVALFDPLEKRLCLGLSDEQSKGAFLSFPSKAESRHQAPMVQALSM